MVHVRDQGMDVQRILQMRSYHLDFFSAGSTANLDSCLTPQLRMATITSTETSSTLDLNKTRSLFTDQLLNFLTKVL